MLPREVGQIFGTPGKANPPLTRNGQGNAVTNTTNYAGINISQVNQAGSFNIAGGGEVRPGIQIQQQTQNTTTQSYQYQSTTTHTISNIFNQVFNQLSGGGTIGNQALTGTAAPSIGVSPSESATQTTSPSQSASQGMGLGDSSSLIYIIAVVVVVIIVATLFRPKRGKKK
jgi:hypothetical protein